ncbi:MAG: 4a-hydroxytetrahydrobiopterin dehydratase [Geminicoccaceae bacterium]
MLCEDEVRSKLTGALSEWRVEDGQLRRDYRTKSYKATLLTANAIGFLAEAANHHPEMVLGYRELTISLVTHDAGGLTEKDLQLAGEIEVLVSKA